MYAPKRAAPHPRIRSVGEIRTHRITFDVADELQKMSICFAQKRFISSLVEVPVTNRLVLRMPPLRVSEGEPVHKAGEVAILPRVEDKMPMIRHYREGEYSHIYTLASLFEDSFKKTIVFLGLKQR